MDFCTRVFQLNFLKWLLVLILMGALSGVVGAAPPFTPTTQAIGNVYYVAPGGDDDGPGTASEPWETLQHAADTVEPGDQVVVRDGEYAGFRLETSGTAEDTIHFRAEGEGAIINADGPAGDGICLQNVSYVVVEGFRIQNVSGRGIAHRGATPVEPVYGLVIRGDTVFTLAEWQALGYDGGSFVAQPDDLFVNVAAADYWLKTGAAAIDAGLLEFEGHPAPTQDIVGVGRPVGAAIDVGAYEFASALVLRGAPANRAIHLSWSVNTTLPPTSTWQIGYQSQTGTLYPTITGIVSPTRAYTLTGLTNYVWYTVTLNAMLDSTPFLTDTVRVTPTDRFAYLPIVLRGN